MQKWFQSFGIWEIIRIKLFLKSYSVLGSNYYELLTEVIIWFGFLLLPNDVFFILLHILCPALCVELWWMGKTEVEIVTNSIWKDINRTIRYTRSISSGSDTFSGCSWDSACYLWNNKTRMCKAGSLFLQVHSLVFFLLSVSYDIILFLLSIFSGFNGKLLPQYPMQPSHVIAN